MNGLPWDAIQVLSLLKVKKGEELKLNIHPMTQLGGFT